MAALAGVEAQGLREEVDREDLRAGGRDGEAVGTRLLDRARLQRSPLAMHAMGDPIAEPFFDEPRAQTGEHGRGDAMRLLVDHDEEIALEARRDDEPYRAPLAIEERVDVRRGLIEERAGNGRRDDAGDRLRREPLLAERIRDVLRVGRVHAVRAVDAIGADGDDIEATRGCEVEHGVRAARRAFGMTRGVRDEDEHRRLRVAARRTRVESIVNYFFMAA